MCAHLRLSLGGAQTCRCFTYDKNYPFVALLLAAAAQLQNPEGTTERIRASHAGFGCGWTNSWPDGTEPGLGDPS